MIRRPMQWLALCVAVVTWAPCASAQEPACLFYKVQSSTLNVSKKPRGDAAYTDVLDNADVVCVTREQSAGGRNWGLVEHKLVKPDQRKAIGGWVNLAALQPLSAADGAAARGLTVAPAAPAPAPPPAPAASPAPAPAPRPRSSKPHVPFRNPYGP